MIDLKRFWKYKYKYSNLNTTSSQDMLNLTKYEFAIIKQRKQWTKRNKKVFGEEYYDV